MTVMGWTVSDECEEFISAIEKKLSKRVLFSNEPLDGEKSRLQSLNQNIYYIYFDMNRIEIGEEFENLIKEEMMHALELDRERTSSL